MYEQYIASQCEELHGDHSDNGIRKHHNDGSLQLKIFPNAKLSTSNSNSITKNVHEGTFFI
jgi:phage replication-related protein YjqB (UPF0714/DUF867 family)